MSDSRKLAAILALEDGTIFRGCAIGAEGVSVGEVVFNTSMTGYQEILTDPSYASQIVTLTYPHIGNVGVTEEDEEAGQIFSKGLVIRDLPKQVSNWRAQTSLSDYLAKRGVVGIADIDTRKLTRLLRAKGAQSGCLMAGDIDEVDEEKALAEARAFPGLNGMDLAKQVTTNAAYDWHGGTWSLSDGYTASAEEKFKVIAYDFGVKHNILRLLADRGCSVKVIPAQTPAAEVLAEHPDGVFLSNGPGDPEPCDYAIEAIKTFMDKNLPVFGICLGHQLMSIASGATTFKMKTGHHGANHPVQDLDSKQVMITSQNHGFAVSSDGLPECLRITHESLFDGTVQGVERIDKPAFSFQGHPEASPGPHDIVGLFDRFIDAMTEAQKNA